MRPSTSPGRMEKDTSLSAVRCPYRLVRSATWSTLAESMNGARLLLGAVAAPCQGSGIGDSGLEKAGDRPPRPLPSQSLVPDPRALLRGRAGLRRRVLHVAVEPVEPLREHVQQRFARGVAVRFVRQH